MIYLVGVNTIHSWGKVFKYDPLQNTLEDTKQNLAEKKQREFFKTIQIYDETMIAQSENYLYVYEYQK